MVQWNAKSQPYCRFAWLSVYCYDIDKYVWLERVWQVPLPGERWWGSGNHYKNKESAEKHIRGREAHSGAIGRGS